MSAIAILHPANLVGKELRESLENRMKEWREVRLLSTDPDEVGTLTEMMGAAAMVQRYEPESLHGVSTVYFCGPIEASRPLFDDIPAGAIAVILSPDATPDDGQPIVAGVNTDAARSGTRLLSPNPAVVLLAHVLAPLRSFQPVDLVATLVQPASTQGDPGIQELFEGTREIVAMISRSPTPIFGAQLAFNLLPTSAEELPLSDLLQKILPEMPPIPFHVLQGGIFHGLAASLHVRFGGSPTPKALQKALKANPHVELADDPRHLGPVTSATNDKVILGTIRPDTAGGFWLWAVMDNLTRGGALNAIEVAEAVEG